MRLFILSCATTYMLTIDFTAQPIANLPDIYFYWCVFIQLFVCNRLVFWQWQALVIGVRKCGTRALLEMLYLHPRIQKAAGEVHFFDRDENYWKGLEWYRKKMPHSFRGQITIEKSPSYFVTPEVSVISFESVPFSSPLSFIIQFIHFECHHYINRITTNYSFRWQTHFNWMEMSLVTFAVEAYLQFNDLIKTFYV